MRQKIVEHFLTRDALRVGPDVHSGDYLAAGALNGYGHRAEAEFKFLIHNGVAVAQNCAQDWAEFVGGNDGAIGVARELNAREKRFELVGRQIREEDAAHGGAEGRQATADAEVNSHDAGHVGARNVNDIETIESGDGA